MNLGFERWRWSGDGIGILRYPAVCPTNFASKNPMEVTTDVSNTWLAIQLGMGSPFYVGRQVGKLRHQVESDAKATRLLRRLEVKGKA